MAAKITPETVEKIEQITGLTLQGYEKEDYAKYDGFLYYKDEWRHIVEIKTREGRYTLKWFEDEETILLDTAKVENLQFLSWLHAVRVTLFFQTADGHLIVFKLTNSKGEYLVDVSDKRVEIHPTHRHSKRKKEEPVTRLKIEDSTIYEFKE